MDIMDEEMRSRHIRSVRHSWFRFHELADDDPMLDDFPDYLLPPYSASDRRKWEEHKRAYGKGGCDARDLME